VHNLETCHDDRDPHNMDLHNVKRLFSLEPIAVTVRLLFGSDRGLALFDMYCVHLKAWLIH
jgi:hypothetical protein